MNLSAKNAGLWKTVIPQLNGGSNQREDHG